MSHPEPEEYPQPILHPPPQPTTAAEREAERAIYQERVARPTDLERHIDRARALMLGLALGESIGLGALTLGAQPIKAGVATQLAAFTVEGYIRAAVRWAHRGICHPPSVIWRAYCRWGVGQRIDGLDAAKMPGSGGDRSGWLCHVPALQERRGNAPRTVQALLGRQQGSIEQPLNSSMGWHGLARTLPLTLHSWAAIHDTTLPRKVTALTHGSPLALDVTSAAIAIGVALMSETTVHEGLRAGMDAVRTLGLDPRLDEACERAIASDALGVQTLRTLAPDATAWSALVGGLHVVAAHPDPDQFVAALRYAAQAREGAAVAAVAGALLGAAHGMVALPVELVSRHELSWALDTLARDLVTQRTDSPGGSEYTPARDDTWTTRYPGY